MLICLKHYFSSLDKALHSLGYKAGYALSKPQLPNPINIIMVYAQKVTLLILSLRLTLRRDMLNTYQEYRAKETSESPITVQTPVASDFADGFTIVNELNRKILGKSG